MFNKKSALLFVKRTLIILSIIEISFLVIHPLLEELNESVKQDYHNNHQNDIRTVALQLSMNSTNQTEVANMIYWWVQKNIKWDILLCNRANRGDNWKTSWNFSVVRAIIMLCTESFVGSFSFPAR